MRSHLTAAFLVLGLGASPAWAAEVIESQAELNPQYRLDLTPKNFVLVRGREVLHDVPFADAVADVAPDLAQRIRANDLNGCVARSTLWLGTGIVAVSVLRGGYATLTGETIAVLPNLAPLSLYLVGLLGGGALAAGGWAYGAFFHRDGHAFTYAEAASTVNQYNNLLARTKLRQDPLKILTEDDLRH